MTDVNLEELRSPPDDAEEQAWALFEKARALFAREHPLIVGSVLANLTALWLASHLVPEGQEETAAYREDLLRRHMEAVRAMVPANEARVADVLRALRERAH